VRWVLLLSLLACSEQKKARKLDPDLIRVSSDARMRTDKVGSGEFEDTATFVLVEATNDAGEGAYVTLGGQLNDSAKNKVADLTMASLWIPAHATRAYALVDTERKPRPQAVAATILMRGAQVPVAPPTAHVEDIHQFPDQGRIVANGMLVNDADREGVVEVIAVFHDKDHRPMTRPFQMVDIAPRNSTTVQFVGPVGSVDADIYVGDMAY